MNYVKFYFIYKFKTNRTFRVIIYFYFFFSRRLHFLCLYLFHLISSFHVVFIFYKHAHIYKKGNDHFPKVYVDIFMGDLSIEYDTCEWTFDTINRFKISFYRNVQKIITFFLIMSFIIFPKNIKYLYS
jgi:hypothetical protein